MGLLGVREEMEATMEWTRSRSGGGDVGPPQPLGMEVPTKKRILYGPPGTLKERKIVFFVPNSEIAAIQADLFLSKIQNFCISI